ncbi:MAG: hypothetical protein CM1200mP22_14540 [Dehalococcoidia bacterium]|nr:MAG: hypothetical protein CM1200mP22_14540 [Dehalococcoidia bacterium]
MVKPDDLTDVESAGLARKHSQKGGGRSCFPWSDQVTVIRETRNVEYAK